MNQESADFNNLQIINYLKDLDSRLSRVEAKLNIEFEAPIESPGDSNSKRISDSKAVDMNLGEYWFANLGILVLTIFFSFLLAKPYPEINQFFPTVFGFAVLGVMLFLSGRWQTSYTNISRYLFGSGLFLLYVSVMRLFYFSPEPALTGNILKGILLLAVSGAIISVSIRKKSLFLIGMGFFLATFTGLFIGHPFFLFSLLVLVSLGFVILHHSGSFRKFSLSLFGIILVFISHVFWIINTPFFSDKLTLLAEPTGHIYFLLIYFMIFAGGFLIGRTKEKEEDLEVSLTFINTVLAFLIYSASVLFIIKENIPFSMLIFSFISLALAILYWRRTGSIHSTYILTINSFISLSIGILAFFDYQDAFIPLVLQSLVVIAFAIWFKSRIIVVSNFAIFLIILVAYLATGKSFGLTTASVGIAGLISARILNWQKDRLTLQTEFLRNVYLGIAFITIPLSLIKILPFEFIGLSLIGLAAVYYVLSGLLTNPKYRWMANLTLLGSMIYILIFGLSNLSLTYQVITLFALAVALISVSVFYTRMRVKSGAN